MSGDTSAGGLRRLDWALDGDVRVLIVALGAQRRPARPVGRRDEAEPDDDHRTRARARTSSSSSPAWKRRPTTVRSTCSRSARRFATWRRKERVLFIPFLLDKVAGQAVAEPGRRHPSQRRGRAPGRRHGLAGAAIGARPDGRRLDDRAARRLEDRAERRRDADDPASARSARFPAAAWLPITGAVRQRQVDAARPHRRARRAVDRARSSSTASTSPRLGEDALARLRGTRIGFVFQFFHLLPSLTAFENVLVPIEIAGGADAGATGRRRCSPKSACRIAAITIRRSSRAASSSASRSRARSPTIRRSCWPTSRPATSTARTGRHVIDLLLRIHRARGRRSSS